MSLTPSRMLPLGTLAPAFQLIDTVSGNVVDFQDCHSDVATVVMFICNHCPYVKYIAARLVEVAKAYQSKGVKFVAISSNDVAHYPEDGPEQMKALAIADGYTFPYLYDETQDVAKAYQAACTPDFFVFDQQQRCVYRGRFDESSPGKNVPVTGADLAQALDCLLNKQPISDDQKPSMGCNIKWKVPVE